LYCFKVTTTVAIKSFETSNSIGLKIYAQSSTIVNSSAIVLTWMDDFVQGRVWAFMNNLPIIITWTTATHCLGQTRAF